MIFSFSVVFDSDNSIKKTFRTVEQFKALQQQKLELSEKLSIKAPTVISSPDLQASGFDLILQENEYIYYPDAVRGTVLVTIAEQNREGLQLCITNMDKQKTLNSGETYINNSGDTFYFAKLDKAVLEVAAQFFNVAILSVNSGVIGSIRSDNGDLKFNFFSHINIEGFELFVEQNYKDKYCQWTSEMKHIAEKYDIQLDRIA
jgi:hypothetical protein